MNAVSATAEDLTIATAEAGATGDKARPLSRDKRRAGDARRTIGWFIILSLVTWAWVESAPSAFARAAPENLADLAEVLSPAVVNISTEQVIEKADGQGNPRGKATPFDELFQDFFDSPESQSSGPRRAAAMGSGFIIDAEARSSPTIM